MTLTKDQYIKFDEAVKYFNEKLFAGELPDLLVTLQRHPRSAGYYHAEKLEDRQNKKRIAEIALNPDVFSSKSDEEILSTLVHEMVHHWQFCLATAPRKAYHDREWAEKMKEVGLYPSSTGEEGGKETGQSMSHYIMQGGLFEKACKAFLLKGKALYLDSIVEPKEEKERKKTREKFVCPVCLQQAWAKKTAKLACGIDLVAMKIEEDDE